MFKTLHALIIGLCFFLGITIAAYLLSQTMLNARTGVNTASVKGLSERQVKADELRWDINFSGSQTNAVFNNVMDGAFDRAAILASANKSRAAALSALEAAGFSANEISTSPISYETYASTDGNGNTVAMTANMKGQISVHSATFDKIASAQDNMLQAIVDGAEIAQQSPRYLFNSLNDIKPDMLREATQNARLAADEFAKNANVNVGGIQDASQGGFSVSDLGSDGSEDQQIDKIVRVVVNATFYLEN